MRFCGLLIRKVINKIMTQNIKIKIFIWFSGFLERKYFLKIHTTKDFRNKKNFSFHFNILHSLVLKLRFMCREFKEYEKTCTIFFSNKLLLCNKWLSFARSLWVYFIIHDASSMYRTKCSFMTTAF